MAILDKFVRNEYGAGFVFAADPEQHSYHLTFKPWHASIDAMADDVLELVRLATFPKSSAKDLAVELGDLMAQPWDPGADPKCLDMPDGDSVITLELPDDVLLTLFKRAHELDITFNQYLVRILTDEIARLNKLDEQS